MLLIIKSKFVALNSKKIVELIFDTILVSNIAILHIKKSLIHTLVRLPTSERSLNFGNVFGKSSSRNNNSNSI